jgi:hypothetical protein
VNEEFFISLVGEIFQGYSEVDFNGSQLYLKHLAIKDQSYLNVFYEKYRKSAIKKGLPEEKKALLDLKEEGMWSDEEDLQIQNLKSEVENLKDTKKSAFLSSAQKKIQSDIDRKEIEYYTLLSKRKEIVGKTAEDYASGMSLIEMSRYFLFKDKALTQHAFSEEEFDFLDDEDILILNKAQEEISNKFDELNIQKSCLRPFFSMYLSYCDNAYGFYGKALSQISVYQLKLVLFGRIFHSIFQYTEDIPDSIRDDPEKLLAYSESKNSKDGGKKGKPFIDDNAAGSTVFGGTKEDISDISGDIKAVSLTDEIKKAGGKLNMEQMMKLSGQ